MKKSYGFRSALIIIGILLFYIMQMSPSPVLHLIRDEFALEGRDLLLNLSVSVIFPTIVLGALTGTELERRLGIKALYSLAIGFNVLGAMICMFCGSTYLLFLLGRGIFGLGFGLGIPFIGSAIMRWFRPEHRELMDTVNSMFPFFGTTIAYLLVMPLSQRLPGIWRTGTSLWGFPLLLILLLWQTVDSEHETAPQASVTNAGIYAELLRRREIVLLCITFVCDFCCYSYIGVILPSLLSESSELAPSIVDICGAVAFPLMGAFGAVCGGLWCRRSGLRKPSLVTGQALKFLGISIMALLGPRSVGFTLGGTALFGFSNGLWMPAMYCIPMELEDMTAEKVGVAFGLISACGLVFGFVAPSVGGILTNVLMALHTADGGAHVFGLRWSLFAFGLLNLVGLGCMLCLRETGPER